MATEPSKRLRDLADAFDADAMTYGREVALDILVSDLSTALDDIAVAAEGDHDA